ncbi:MAG: hypothetical protein WCK35_14285, partial [Chloroflexota bacterium]
LFPTILPQLPQHHLDSQGVYSSISYKFTIAMNVNCTMLHHAMKQGKAIRYIQNILFDHASE